MYLLTKIIIINKKMRGYYSNFRTGRKIQSANNCARIFAKNASSGGSDVSSNEEERYVIIPLLLLLLFIILPPLLTYYCDK